MFKNIKNIIFVLIAFLLLGSIYLFSKDIGEHMIYSIKRVAIGFFLASMFGIFFGFLLGNLKKIGFVRYLFEIIRPIPPIARIPIAILWFGLGDNSAYFIVFIGSFFPIFTNTYFGITSIPKMYLDISKNLGLNKFDFYYNILWKYSLPYIFSGLKIGLGMGWMSLIAAELIGSQNGLGYYIQINRLLLNTENIILGMALIGLIGFGLNFGLNKIEKILIRWEH